MYTKCCTICIFILVRAPVIFNLKLQLDGKMDFGPKWNYEYRIKPLENETDNPTRKLTAMDKVVYVQQQTGQPKFIDIIIKNKKSNPHLIQVAEAHIYDKKNNKHHKTIERNDKTQKIINIQNISDVGKKHKRKNIHRKNITEEPTIIFSDEHTELLNVNLQGKNTNTGKYVKHIIRLAGNIGAPKPDKLEMLKESLPEVSDEDNKYIATVLTPEQTKRKRYRVKYNDAKISLVPEFVNNNNSKHKRHRHRKKLNGTNIDIPIIRHETVKQNFSNQVVANKISIEIDTQENEPRVSLVKEDSVKNLYVKPRLVKDDPKIREFTRHIYEQSVKTIKSMKEKMDNYAMRKEADRLLRTYEERFGDFVRETQNQKIKTGLGRQKVILNTLDTSNRILDRLVNFMLGKMDKKGILRNKGTNSVIMNDLNKNKDLENKHLCIKMNLCPTNDSFIKFSVDILQSILRSPDKKIVEIRDALTEVLKNTDFSQILYPDTEKRFHRSMNDMEKYGIDTLRPLFFIMKNVLESKNSPIEVVGKEDDRVNKTLAFLDLIDGWEKKLPPNEQNILEWNDMRNSFKEWRSGKRKDTIDLMQHFTQHVIKAISKDDAKKTQLRTDKNLNIMLG